MDARMTYFDRNGQPVSQDQWACGFEDSASRIVARDEVAGRTVSTVWLGLNHNFNPTGRPLIFETMVFPEGSWEEEEEVERYSTEEEALAGHAAMVDRFRSP